jgi:hypothetical protein
VERQRELDRREASFHAQLAEWQAEHAQTRLALDERERAILVEEAALHERAAELAARENEVSKRASASRGEHVEAEFFLRRQEDELDVREAQVKLAEERLATEQHLVRKTAVELAAAKDRFRRAARRLQQQHERRRQEFEQSSQQTLAALERRRAAIETTGLASDSADAAPHDEIDQLRTVLRMELLAVQQLLDERERDAQDLERQRQEFQTLQDQELTRLGERELDLMQLAEQIDMRRGALELSEETIAAQHQTVLRERLALEELWARFGAREDVAVHRPKLAEIELRLVERYAGIEDRISARQQELETLRAELKAEHTRLARQQLALETWTATREQEIAERTRTLTKRTEDLDARTKKTQRTEIELGLAKLNRRNSNPT